MLTDRDSIRERVLRGDAAYAIRVLLTALIKGDDEIRKRILEEIDQEDFNLPALDVIFDAIYQSLQAKGKVDEGYLYHKMEDYVGTQLVASEIAFIDRVLASELPNNETLNRAIAVLQKAHAGEELTINESFIDSERVVVVALIKGDKQSQSHILKEMSVGYFDASIDRIFEWARQLLRTEEKVDKEALYQKGKNYVISKVMPGYIAPINHILAIDMPDGEMIDKAIACLKNRRPTLRVLRLKRNE
jgi:hypothetical protein